MQFWFADNAQRYTIINNYIKAADYWTNASIAVINLVSNVQITEHEERFTNCIMEHNVLSKSSKASGTFAGEAFEPFNWTQPYFKDDILFCIGPGETKGDDLVEYENKRPLAEAEIPGENVFGFLEPSDKTKPSYLSKEGTAFGEVKTLDDGNTYYSIAKILYKKGLLYSKLELIVLYVDPYTYDALSANFKDKGGTVQDGDIGYYNKGTGEIKIICKYDTAKEFSVYRSSEIPMEMEESSVTEDLNSSKSI